MGFLETLLLVIGNTAVPGLGFFASIVSAISSDDRNAGGKFLFSLATSVLPSNFWSDLASGLIGDMVFESDAYSAAQLLVPTNNIAVPCGVCGHMTNKYVLRNGKILCAGCLSSDINGHMKKDYNIYVYRQKVSVLHGKFIAANKLTARRLATHNLKGRRI
jgi:hypothetical protein